MEDGRGWLRAFLREVLTMPRKHVLVFLLATILLIIMEVEVVEGEGWHLVHLFELLGFMLFLYMGWVTWRVARILRKQGKP
ncbi:MAG: hypothetical protein CV088_15335 [Nitrospira sp. LK70]|nr:hypothetical protein [Nitrospira sp. LK70]